MNFGTFLSWESTTRDTIDFKVAYVDMAGDLVAGLLLSQIIYYYLPDKSGNSPKLRVFKDDHYWIAKQREEWWDEIRISPKQVDRALGILIEKNIIIKNYYMFSGQRTMHIRINPRGFMAAWGGVTNRGEDRSLPKGKTDVDESERPITETTTETTTTTTPDGEKEKSLVSRHADSSDPTGTPDITAQEELNMWFGSAGKLAGDSNGMRSLQLSDWAKVKGDTFLTAACVAYLDATGWDIPAFEGTRKKWIIGFNQHRQFPLEALVRLYTKSYKRMRDQSMTINGPMSLTSTMEFLWQTRNEQPPEESREPQYVPVWKETGEVVT